MAFQRGKPKTGGQQPGTPNRTTLEIKDFGRAWWIGCRASYVMRMS